MILKYLKLLEANKKISKKNLSNIDHSLAKTICSVNVWRTLEHFGSQSPVRPVCTRWRSSIIIDDYTHLRKSPVFQCYNGSIESIPLYPTIVYYFFLYFFLVFSCLVWNDCCLANELWIRIDRISFLVTSRTSLLFFDLICARFGSAGSRFSM